ncbi:hypothetical protein ASZ90_001973 [hydrocarbon metagenome]|uniref:Uncharacterized protein n=1 Tax=hydrocarbon metagenome TaxID=938273 RepID=A0A0W8G4S8_9ZZZZ
MHGVKNCPDGAGLELYAADGRRARGGPGMPGPSRRIQ